MSTQPTQATKNAPSKNKPNSDSPFRIWAIRLALGLGLLLALKIGYDFYNHFYYTEELPSFQELANHWNVFRIAELLHNRTLLWRVFPRARVLSFVLFMWAVLLVGAAVLVFEYFCYFTSRGKRRNRFVFYVRFRNLVLSVAGFGVLCIAYGFYVEPYWLQVNHLKLASPKISSASGPIRILLFSDLHMGRKLRLEPKLPEVIAEQHPDLIVFAGDAMNSSWVLGKFKQFMLRLGDIAPVIVVKGNQDHSPFWDSKNIYGGTRVRELNNEALTIKIRGTELYFWGQPYDPVYLQPARPSPAPGDYTILLHHTPRSHGGCRARRLRSLSLRTHSRWAGGPSVLRRADYLREVRQEIRVRLVPRRVHHVVRESRHRAGEVAAAGSAILCASRNHGH